MKIGKKIIIIVTTILFAFTAFCSIYGYILNKNNKLESEKKLIDNNNYESVIENKNNLISINELFNKDGNVIDLENNDIYFKVKSLNTIIDDEISKLDFNNYKDIECKLEFDDENEIYSDEKCKNILLDENYYKVNLSDGIISQIIDDKSTQYDFYSNINEKPVSLKVYNGFDDNSYIFILTNNNNLYYSNLYNIKSFKLLYTNVSSFAIDKTIFNEGPIGYSQLFIKTLNNDILFSSINEEEFKFENVYVDRLVFFEWDTANFISNSYISDKNNKNYLNYNDEILNIKLLFNTRIDKTIEDDIESKIYYFAIDEMNYLYYFYVYNDNLKIIKYDIKVNKFNLNNDNIEIQFEDNNDLNISIDYILLGGE